MDPKVGFLLAFIRLGPDYKYKSVMRRNIVDMHGKSDLQQVQEHWQQQQQLLHFATFQPRTRNQHFVAK